MDPATNAPRAWPWPQEDWLFNRPALDAIKVVAYMDQLLKKSDEMWTKEDSNFYKALYEEPESNGTNPISL